MCFRDRYISPFVRTKKTIKIFCCVIHTQFCLWNTFFERKIFFLSETWHHDLFYYSIYAMINLFFLSFVGSYLDTQTIIHCRPCSCLVLINNNSIRAVTRKQTSKHVSFCAHSKNKDSLKISLQDYVMIDVKIWWII